MHPVMQVQYRLWPRTREATTGPQNWADMEFPALGKAEGSGLYGHAHLPRGGRGCQRSESTLSPEVAIFHDEPIGPESQ